MKATRPGKRSFVDLEVTIWKRAGADLASPLWSDGFHGLRWHWSKLGTISAHVEILQRRLLVKFKPDVVILIDYGGLTEGLRSSQKPRVLKHSYYIPPKIWAWYQKSCEEKLRRMWPKLFRNSSIRKDSIKSMIGEVDMWQIVLDAIKAFRTNPNFLSEARVFQRGNPLWHSCQGAGEWNWKFIVPLMTQIVKGIKNFQFGVAAGGRMDASLIYPEATPRGEIHWTDTYNLLRVSQARSSLRHG